MWIVMVICAVLSIILLSGRGSFLIAGYNTADKEEKAKYDEKKLCRVMGAGMSVITVILLLCNVYEYDLPRGLRWIMPVGIFGVVIFLVIATNTICRKKVPGTTSAARKKDTFMTKVTVAVLVAIGLLVAAALYTGDVNVRFEMDGMNIHTSVIGNKRVEYEDIRSVAYEEDMDVGRRTGGIGSFRIQAGGFKNSEFGAYHLYSYTDCDEYVVMETVYGTVVINGKTTSKTRELYQEISERERFFAN
ncbi:DUF3784 domain-containing protein [Extibacter muris]|nr:DUF3784 domain-containing protein [Extibacter muris]MCB6201726.1 DUF3784 domain-containing protein [Extibacter muris]MCQ4663517.1 DUF3784 domain-containing protein [Extibacter muris]MCQ4693500.1 DUF3784 domain-containing protein [Extibacter muris]